MLYRNIVYHDIAYRDGADRAVIRKGCHMDIFTTERLIIRRFVPDDRRDLHEYLSREEVVRFEPYNVYDEDASRKEAVRRASDDNFWAVCLKTSGTGTVRSGPGRPWAAMPNAESMEKSGDCVCGKLIGNIYLSAMGHGTWELGYVFNDGYWGRGYATEAARALLCDVFVNRGARRVTAMCNPQNISSWKLLERLGMRREGNLVRNVSFKKDAAGRSIWQDTYEYAILAEEWNEHRRSGFTRRR